MANMRRGLASVEPASAALANRKHRVQQGQGKGNAGAAQKLRRDKPS